MYEEVKQITGQIAEKITTTASFGWFSYIATQFAAFWVTYGSPIFDALAAILGVILLITLIRYHWKKGSNL